MLQPIKFCGRSISLLDQRFLPGEELWIKCDSLEKAATAIEDMVVRGAPAIGCTAGFALAMDAAQLEDRTTWRAYQATFISNCERLAKTRPTAVNLFNTIQDFKNLSLSFGGGDSAEKFSRLMVELAISIFDGDLEACRAIGDHGSNIVADGKRVNVLTHCNAGALATAGYGTALGVVRSLHAEGKLGQVFVDETRPYLQGARLTAFEMIYEEIPHQLITDSSAAYLMQLGKIDIILVGADRITLNGDVANKIGTYSVAVNANYHGIPFYVAAPLTTFDFEMQSGDQINIEKRDPSEVSHFKGQLVSPKETAVLNFSFDVTPHHLVSGIITEKGVLYPPYDKSIFALR